MSGREVTSFSFITAAEREVTSVSAVAGTEVPIDVGVLASPVDDERASQGSAFENGPRSYPGRIFVLQFRLRPLIPAAHPRRSEGSST